MEELTEQQKIARIKMESMQNLAHGISVDFKPILNKIKELIEHNKSKEEIFREIDSLLGLIAQLEKFSGMDKEK